VLGRQAIVGREDGQLGAGAQIPEQRLVLVRCLRDHPAAVDIDDERPLPLAVGPVEAQRDAMPVVGDRLVMGDLHRLDRDTGALGDDLEQQPAVRPARRDVPHCGKPPLGARRQQRRDGVVRLGGPRGARLRRG
jgi:hypothetical protein